MGWDLIKDLLGLKGTIIVSNSCMIPSYDEMGSAIVLSKYGVEQRLPWACITHFQRVTLLDDTFLGKVVFYQNINTINSYLSGDIPFFQLADKLMDEKSITDFQSDLGKIFMGAMHGIPELQSGDGFPSLFLKETSSFDRSCIDGFEFFRVVSFTENQNRSPQIDLSLFHHLRHPRMLDIICFEDLFALINFINRIFLMNDHAAHKFIVFIILQSNFLTFLQISGDFSRDRECNGNGPEEPVRHLHLVTYSLPICLSHEAVQRAEGSNSHHDEIISLTGGHSNFLKGFCLMQSFLQRFSFKKQRF